MQIDRALFSWMSWHLWRGCSGCWGGWSSVLQTQACLLVYGERFMLKYYCYGNLCLYVHPSVFLSVCLSGLSIWMVYMWAHPSFCLFETLNLCSWVCVLLVSPLVWLTCLSLWQSVCLSVFLSYIMSVHLSVSAPVCTIVCLSLNLSVNLLVVYYCLSIYLSHNFLSVHLSACPFDCLLLIRFSKYWPVCLFTLLLEDLATCML